MSKSPSLRRIKADIRELSIDPSDQYYAAPLETDMFEWHFTIRGPADTEFAGGVYHGKILLPPEYPFKPPNIVFLTPSGRFETNTKVCLSFSAHHPELWQPAWGIRLILEALISFLPTPADGAITLTWDCDESGGRLTVQDTGEGIDEADIPRLTERFFRVDRGRSREDGGGIGLGLAIVKHALGRHEARLEVESKLGEGSNFTCHFPTDRLASAEMHSLSQAGSSA